MTSAQGDRLLCQGRHWALPGRTSAERLAARGSALCARCLSDLGQFVAYSSYMVEHLDREIPKSHQWPAEDEPRFKAFESKSPANDDALDAANREVALLANAAIWLAHDTGVASPDLAGLWRRPGGEVLGARLDHPGEADKLVVFLLRRFDQLAALDWAPGLLEAVKKTRAPHLARWPLEMRESVIKDVLCYRCKRHPLRVYPPRDYGDPLLVQCPVCGYVVPESMYAHIRAVIEQEQREQRSARARRPARP